MEILSNEEWAVAQFGECDFNDSRLNARAIEIGKAMLDDPSGSINSQNASWSATKGAYRFFKNEKTSFETVITPHLNNTLSSCQSKRVLIIGDITEVNYTSHTATEGLGMLGDGKGRGFQLHSCLAYDTASEQILGLASARINYRVCVPKNETRTQRLARWKESDLWSAAICDVGAHGEGTDYIFVFDRGSDIFDVYANAQMQSCDWVIRASRLNRKVLFNNQELSLGEAIHHAREIGQYTLDLRARPNQKARTATLTVSSVSVEFKAPRLKSPWLKQVGIDSVSQNVVILEEKNPPKNQKAIKWVLLTSLPVKTMTQCWHVIEYYEKRWLVEEYHKALKTGCSTEKSELRTAARLETHVAMTAILATRLLSLKLISRNDETTKAKAHVPKVWLDSLMHYRPNLDTKAEGFTVRQFIHEVAKVGGFNGRKHDGEPGWQSIWRGIIRLTWIAKGMKKALPRCG